MNLCLVHLVHGLRTSASAGHLDMDFWMSTLRIWALTSDAMITNVFSFF